MTAKRLLDDCFLHDKDRLKHHEALAILKDRLTTIADAETIRLEDSLERILAEDVSVLYEPIVNTRLAPTLKRPWRTPSERCTSPVERLRCASRAKSFDCSRVRS